MTTSPKPFFYCSELSRADAEKTFGTASVGGTWLLLEYPHPWGRRVFEDDALAPEVKTFLTNTLETIPRSRLLFVKQQRRQPGQNVSFFVVRARERDPFAVRFRLGLYEELLELDIAAVAAGRPGRGGVLTREPLFLVCTHGRRDKCCAKFGYPLYKSLKTYAGEAVWQSSHVGGDRFAANVVCFPHGLFYAHATEETAPRLLDEYKAGRLVLDKYRGRACYSYPVQAAEFFARSESGLRGLAELHYLKCERAGERSWSVKFTAADDGRVFEVRVGCRQSDFRNYVTCHAAEERSVTQYVLEEFRASRAEANGRA